MSPDDEFRRDIHARRLDPPTSHKAAAGRDSHAVVTRGSQKHKLLDVYYKTANATSDEACRRAGFTPGIGAPWKRVSDLHAARYLEATGDERVTRSGKAAAVLQITPAGVKAWETLDGDPKLRVYRP